MPRLRLKQPKCKKQPHNQLTTTDTPMAQDLHLGGCHSNCKRTGKLAQVAWEEYLLHDSTNPPRNQPDHQMRIRLPWKEKQHAQNLEMLKRRPFMVDICTIQFPASRRPYTYMNMSIQCINTNTYKYIFWFKMSLPFKHEVFYNLQFHHQK